jgi:chromosome segregation ATPase
MGGKGPKKDTPRYYQKLQKNRERYEKKSMEKLRQKPVVQKMLEEERRRVCSKMSPSVKATLKAGITKIVEKARRIEAAVWKKRADRFEADLRACTVRKNVLFRNEQKHRAEATHFERLAAHWKEEAAEAKKKMEKANAKLKEANERAEKAEHQATNAKNKWRTSRW